MKVGMLGLGKLGLPVSVAMSQKGHEVWGYDVDSRKLESYIRGKAGLWEPDIDQELQQAEKSGRYHIVKDAKDAVKDKDIVFVAVPTPSKYDNSFDTKYVVEAVKSIGTNLERGHYTDVVIISTILPGTMRKTVFPELRKATSPELAIGRDYGLCYNASFIAMGTTIADFLSPEFVLLGESDKKAGDVLEKFYEPLVESKVPRLHMSWENAELVKMSYNTFIGFKIVVANTLMEMCHKLPTADVDVVSDALSKASVRIVGPRYLRGGMGDGGACHPRDQLALSWLGKELDLSANPFEYIMDTRRRQAEWLADIMCKQSEELGYAPLVIMGVRYKPNSNLIDYSAALLVKDVLKSKGNEPIMYDPVAISGSSPPKDLPAKSSVYLIAIDDKFVHEFDFAPGSVIVDPWRCFTPDETRRLNDKKITYAPVGKGGRV